MEKRLEEILCAHFTTKHEFEFRHESGLLPFCFLDAAILLIQRPLNLWQNILLFFIFLEWYNQGGEPAVVAEWSKALSQIQVDRMP